jgi:hypothetical protein
LTRPPATSTTPAATTTDLADMAPQAKAGGQPRNRTRPASSPWALFSSNKPCPKRKDGGCRKARANGDELLVYAGPSESVRVCRLESGSVYRYRWKKAVRPGFVAPAATATPGSSGCVRIENPSGKFAILHLEKTPA